MTTTKSALRRIFKSKRNIDFNISYKEENNFDIVLENELNVIIGRDSECDVIISCIEISRKHAIIKYIDKNWFITDLESTNGIFINGTQLLAFSPYCLSNGDQISFGPKSNSKYVYEFVSNYCPKAKKRVICETSDGNESNDKSIDSEVKRLCNEENAKQMFEIIDSELSCIICHELFVSAVNLNCSHTFCLYCIEQWKHQHNECPICRQEIKNQNRALVLDNLIENMVLKMKPQQKQHRKELIEERKHIIYSSEPSSKSSSSEY